MLEKNVQIVSKVHVCGKNKNNWKNYISPEPIKLKINQSDKLIKNLNIKVTWNAANCYILHKS